MGTSAWAFSKAVVVTGDTPQNLDLPTVGGTAAVGQTLSTTNGTWNGSGLSYAYQWQRGTTYVDPVLGDGAAEYWRLDDASGTTAADLVPGAPTGTYTGGFTLGQSGAFPSDPDTATSLNGTSGLVRVNSPVAFGSGNFSVEAWVKTSSTAQQEVLRQGPNPGTPGRVKLEVKSGGTVMFDLIDTASTEVSVTTTRTVDDGIWHHVVATRAGSVLTIYVDGLQAAQGTVSVGNVDGVGRS